MALKPGDLLHNERYRIVELVGSGGFGVVYRAVDQVMWNRHVAVKSNNLLTPQHRDQFEREARLLADLKHNFLPRVTDFFDEPGQGQFMAMDFVEGVSLIDLLEQRGRPLSEAEALPWIQQVCEALDYLHRQTPPVFHRDIKPANIILTPKGHIMLVDFGIAKMHIADQHTNPIDGQLDLCREYAEKSGYSIVAELAEDDRRPTSGASWDLAQLNKALEMARSGEYDVLIARELDRLARNLAKQLVIEEQLLGYGVTVEYVFGDYANTPEGQLNKQIRAVIAEYEREKIKQRMVGGRRRKVAEGEVIIHGNPPYGYRLVEIEGRSALEIVSDMAEVIRNIFDWFTIEKQGTAAIAKRLNGLGIPAPSVAKNTAAPQATRGWSCSAVNRVIHNETYAGTWRYGKRHTTARQVHPEAYHITVSVPAIVSQEVFNTAQEQCRLNLRNSKRNTKGEYLLARHCFCGECNTTMTVAAHKWGKSDYNYYRCSVPNGQVTHYVNRTCNMRTYFRIEHWDAIVWREIRNFLSNPESIQTGAKRFQQEQAASLEPLRNRLATSEKLLARKQKELERLIDLYVSGDFDRDFLLDRKQRLEAEIKSLRSETEVLRNQLSEGLTDEQVAELVAFSRKVADGLDKADSDFALRRRIIEYLNTRVILTVEDGEQVAYLRCQFGYDSRLTKDTSVNPVGTPSLPPGSAPSANFPSAAGDNYTRIDMRSMGYRHN